jgi:hypothetical protein
MALKIDDFDPVSNGDLREFWARFRDRDVRRLILEVVRGRRVMDAALADAQRAHHECWQKIDHHVQAVLKRLIDRLGDERVRLGCMGGNTVKLAFDGQYR